MSSYDGKVLENIAKDYLEKKYNTKLNNDYKIWVGASVLKEHGYDLGNEDSIVECKAYTWGKRGEIPGGKMSTWNEAMMYFYLSPNTYKKVFFVLYDYNQKKKLSLLEYYLKTYAHFIPIDLDIYEWNPNNDAVSKFKCVENKFVKITRN
jgi:hypothetical protein